jgi:hypothetical protein
MLRLSVCLRKGLQQLLLPHAGQEALKLERGDGLNVYRTEYLHLRLMAERRICSTGLSCARPDFRSVG